ncbi:MAG: hypothetical protein AB1736_04730 [Chloroflexota bacterium]
MQPGIVPRIRVLHVAVVVTVMLIATFVIVGRPSLPFPDGNAISADRAVAIARDFAVAGQASNEDIREVRTGKVEAAGDYWRVQVDLLVVWGQATGATPNPSDPPIWIYYLIDVHRTTGAPSIYAQG